MDVHRDLRVIDRPAGFDGLIFKGKAAKPTYAYPVPCTKGILIRDQESVALWAAE